MAAEARVPANALRDIPEALLESFMPCYPTAPGLRPGEKIAEELYTTGEKVVRTRHEKIVVVRNGDQRPITDSRLSQLLEAAASEDGLRIRHLLAEMVPAYSEAERAASPPKVVSGSAAGAMDGRALDL